MRAPRILLSAPASGSGKTLITCGILQALLNRNLRLSAFKCGPDYIDPMFHGRVIGTKSRNLDTFFTDADTTRCLYARNAAGFDVAVVEGVMGYYDGLGGTKVQGSTWDVARTLGIPAVDGRGASLSIVAMIKGFLDYQADSQIRGVILNQVSPMLYGPLKARIEEELPVQVFGYVPKLTALSLDSRHLGLVLPGEIQALKEKLCRLAGELEQTLDLDGMLTLAGTCASDFSEKTKETLAEKIREMALSSRVSVAVARDDAFCFTYLDNLELLEAMGAELLYFSPLEDQGLPEGASGLILSGGYPELHAKALEQNASMRTAVKEAIQGGMPCIAECGGFLYLHKSLEGADGKDYPLAGVLDARAYRREKLTRFGYVTLEALENQMLLETGMEIRGHEFHYWESESCGGSMRAKKPLRKRNWECVHGSGSLYAGFPHLFFYSNPIAAWNFLRKCEETPCMC